MDTPLFTPLFTPGPISLERETTCTVNLIENKDPVAG